MNTKSNQRYKATDDKIRQVFLKLLGEKDLSDTTVQDICNECGINRSTFYAHYTDIYDLLSKMEASIREEMYASFSGTDVSLENFLSIDYLEIILTHIGSHRVFYRAHIESFGRSAIDDGLESIKEYVIKPYFEKLGITSQARLDYHFTFFNHGLIAVIKQWLSKDCPETPGELSRIIWDSIPPVPHE